MVQQKHYAIDVCFKLVGKDYRPRRLMCRTWHEHDAAMFTKYLHTSILTDYAKIQASYLLIYQTHPKFNGKVEMGKL